jgi:integrase
MYAFSASYIPALTLDDQAWAWLREQRPNWKKKSYSSYCSKLRNFLAWKGSKEISNGVIREFLGELRKTHSNGTRNDYLRFLKQIYSGVDAGHHFGKLKKLRHYPETCEHYRPSYIRTIFEHLEEHDQELLFACRCVMYLLVRPQSELRLLKVHNFDTDDWLVTIPSSVAKNHRRETVHVPLNFRARILEYLKGKGPNEYVFPGKKKGTPMGPNNLADRHRKSMNDLGFGMEYKMYGWKNTGNIEYKKAGADIYFISRQNRHSSLEITSIYFRKMGWDDRGTLPDLKIDY